jgi:hypothetical protein
VTLADRYSFGTDEHVALRMPPCQSPRVVRTSRHDFLRVLHPNGYRDLRAIDRTFVKTLLTPVADLDAGDAFATTWHLRIPDHREHPFRSNMNTDSDRC